jgi:hypothetical protein
LHHPNPGGTIWGDGINGGFANIYLFFMKKIPSNFLTAATSQEQARTWQ